MGWHATLGLHYAHGAHGTTLRFTHQGPMRVFKPLYPEGQDICQTVWVHPPGGLVQGDSLALDVSVAPHAHAVLSTPGATRFYGNNSGALAQQQVHCKVCEHARLEWLPLETIVYPGCLGMNTWHATLAPSAEVLAMETTHLGLPGANEAFAQGWWQQRQQIDSVWLDEGTVDATDLALLDGPAGLAGRRHWGTLLLARGSAWPEAQRDALLELARACLGAHPHVTAGVSAVHPQVLLLRALAHQGQHLAPLLREVWGQWRGHAWQLPALAPRTWAM